MANEKISQLTSGGALQASDLLAIARSGSNFKISGASVFSSTNITGILKGDGTSISAASTTGTGDVVLKNDAAIITAPYGLATKDLGGSGNSLIFLSAETLTATRVLNFILSNASRTLTLGGDIILEADFTVTGGDSITFATTAPTSVTLPTTGTLATLAGAETFTNKFFIDNANSFVNWANNSRQFNFDCSAISNDTIRTLTIQDLDGHVALLENTLNQFAETDITDFANNFSGALDGQIFIGKSDGSLAVNTITQGSGISITNGDGTISISLINTEVSFLNQTSIIVNHGLGKKPFIQVVDASGVVINTGVNIKHNSNSQFEITSDEEISGTIIYI